MVMAINLNALRVFTAVVERGGFSRAAEALRISQPVVSKAVRELERPQTRSHSSLVDTQVAMTSN